MACHGGRDGEILEGALISFLAVCRLAAGIGSAFPLAKGEACMRRDNSQLVEVMAVHEGRA